MGILRESFLFFGELLFASEVNREVVLLDFNRDDFLVLFQLRRVFLQRAGGLVVVQIERVLQVFVVLLLVFQGQKVFVDALLLQVAFIGRKRLLALFLDVILTLHKLLLNDISGSHSINQNHRFVERLLKNILVLVYLNFGVGC